MHARVCFGCSVTTPGSRATYTRAHTDAHARATHMRVYTRARSRRSFAITYHYSAWLLELQPRAMFATRLPCAILLLLLLVVLFSLSLSIFLPVSRSFLLSSLSLSCACFSRSSPAPATSRRRFPFSTVPPRSAIPPRSYSASTLAISNYSPQSAEPVAPGTLWKHIFDILDEGIRKEGGIFRRVESRVHALEVISSSFSASSFSVHTTSTGFTFDDLACPNDISEYRD